MRKRFWLSWWLVVWVVVVFHDDAVGSSLKKEVSMENAVLNAMAIRGNTIFFVGYIPTESEGKNFFAAAIEDGVWQSKQFTDGTSYDDELTCIYASNHYIYAGGYTGGVYDGSIPPQTTTKGDSAIVFELSSKLRVSKHIQLENQKDASVFGIKFAAASLYAVGHSTGGMFIVEINPSFGLNWEADFGPSSRSSAEFVERDEFGNLYILGSELLSKGNPAPSSSTVSLMKVDGDSRTKHWVVQLKGSAEKTSPPSSFSALGLVLDFNGFAVMLSREDPSHETTVRKVNRLGEELWTVVLEDSPMTFSLARGLNSVLYILQTQSQGNDTTLIELSSNGRKTNVVENAFHGKALNAMTIDPVRGILAASRLAAPKLPVPFRYDIPHYEPYPSVISGPDVVEVKVESLSPWTSKMKNKITDTFADLLQVVRDSVEMKDIEDQPNMMQLRLPVSHGEGSLWASLLREMEHGKAELPASIANQVKIVGEIQIEKDWGWYRFDFGLEGLDKMLLSIGIIVLGLVIVAATVLTALIVNKRRKLRTKMTNVSNWLGQTRQLVQPIGDRDSDDLSSVHSDDL